MQTPEEFIFDPADLISRKKLTVGSQDQTIDFIEVIRDLKNKFDEKKRKPMQLISSGEYAGQLSHLTQSSVERK